MIKAKIEITFEVSKLPKDISVKQITEYLEEKIRDIGGDDFFTSGGNMMGERGVCANLSINETNILNNEVIRVIFLNVNKECPVFQHGEGEIDGIFKYKCE